MAVTARDVAAERAEMLDEIEGKTQLTLLSDMAERLGDQAARSKPG
jgi:hypothetical protein